MIEPPAQPPWRSKVVIYLAGLVLALLLMVLAYYWR
jgi:hypothetical protein